MNIKELETIIDVPQSVTLEELYIIDKYGKDHVHTVIRINEKKVGYFTEQKEHHIPHFVKNHKDCR